MRRAVVRLLDAARRARAAERHAPRPLVAALLVAAGYYAGAKLGLALTFAPQPVSTLWPPNAILLAGLLLTPPSAWWLVLAAALPAHLVTVLGDGVPLPMVLCWFVSNAAEALLGAALVRRLGGERLRFDRFRGAVVFAFGAGALAPFATSFLDAGFVALNHWGGSGYWEVWRRRFLSNALATLTLVPAIVAAARGGLAALRTASRARRAEAVLLAGALVAVAVGVFATPHVEGAPSSVLLYVPLPLLLWAALRFGPGGTSAGILVVTLLSIWSAVHGLGPFAGGTPEQTAVPLQLFLLVTGVPLLLLAAVVAARRDAEVALRESAYRIALAADAGNLGFWTVDLPSGRRWVSDRLRRIFGMALDVAVTERMLLDPIHPEDRERVLRAREATLAAGAPFTQEYRIVRPDGVVRWVHTIGRVRRVDGGEQVIGVMADVTDRREAELALRDQELVLAHLGRLAVVGELSGAIAHELNQPLTAILANAQTASRMVRSGAIGGPVDFDELEVMLVEITEADRRAAAVLQRIRGLLRNAPLATEPLHPADLAGEVLAITRSELLRHRVVARLDVPATSPRVVGDRVQLQQVLVNLVS